MTTLIDALQTKDTVTTNGMVTNSSSKDSNVDYFFQIGAMRGKDPISLFSKAFAEDPLTAIKILFWSRDVRGGAGERQLFRDVVVYLAIVSPKVLVKNLHLFSEYGRWDDIFILFGTPLEKDVLGLIAQCLAEEDGLLAKWLPRKGAIANKVRRFLNLDPKGYRKLIVGLSNTVEQKMSAKDWESINYETVPSLAMSRYLKSFHKNDGERFSSYSESLVKGEVKVNAGAVYPYDIVKSITTCDNNDTINVSVAQWDSLPNFMEGSEKRILPVVDTSGSMGTGIGTNANLQCIDVAISLGLYISERNEGPFKDAFITFSERPTLQILKGNLLERLASLKSAEWGFSTNLERVFEVVLRQAVKHNLSADEMPTDILILSDMQFDEACVADHTALDMIKEMFDDHGYVLPNIVFWNLNSYGSQAPVSFNEDGTALISGFSPAILKSILSGETFTPYSILMDTIGSERYSAVTI